MHTKQTIDNDTDDKYVYCTDCEEFVILNGIPYCRFHSKCDLFNWKDSRTLSERPMYSKREENN